MSVNTILDAAPLLAHEWAAQRQDRQQRTKSDPGDFETLRGLGIQLLGVPVEFGGFWESFGTVFREGFVRILGVFLRILPPLEGGWLTGNSVGTTKLSGSFSRSY